MYKNRKKRMRRKDFPPDLFNQATKYSWGEDFLVSLNTSKSKRVRLHHWEDLKLAPIMISCQQPQRSFLPTGAKLQSRREMECACLCHRKRFCKKGRFILSPQKITKPAAIFFFYKSQMKPRRSLLLLYLGWCGLILTVQHQQVPKPLTLHCG